MANTNELEQIEFPIVANSAKADETLKALFNKLLGIENKLLDISKKPIRLGGGLDNIVNDLGRVQLALNKVSKQLGNGETSWSEAKSTLKEYSSLMYNVGNKADFALKKINAGIKEQESGVAKLLAYNKKLNKESLEQELSNHNIQIKNRIKSEQEFEAETAKLKAFAGKLQKDSLEQELTA